MTCLLTGSTGFLGSILATEFRHHFDLTTLGRSEGNDLICDLATTVPVLPHGLDWVVHNAGKAHSVPRNEAEAAVFHQVNLQGTEHLLKGIEQSANRLKGIILISTIAVYGLDEGHNITEDTPLKGQTPYAVSKIAAERAVQEWGAAHQVPVLILRLPLVSGPNPPGNLGMMERAMSRGRYVQIVGNTARKSVVSAASIAQWLPGVMGRSGVYHLTDGIHPTFEQIEAWMLKHTKGRVMLRLSAPLLQKIALIGDIFPFFPLNTARFRKLTASLTINDDKARRELGWSPHSAFIQQ